jgi:hypothetical protein
VRQALAIAGAVIGLVTGAGTIVGWIVSTDSPLEVVGKALGYAGMGYALGFAAILFVAAALPKRTLQALEDEGFTKAVFTARALYFGGGCFFAGFFVVVGTDPLDAVWIVTGVVLLYVVGLAGFYVARRAAARYRPCPDCAETIRVAANVCRHCGYRFALPPPAYLVTESPAPEPTPPLQPASPQPDGEAASEAPSEPGPLTSPSAR